MIGTIIGDLAAWTYENERETFWNQLISYNYDKVELSLYAHAYLQAVSINVLSVPNQNVNIVRNTEWSPEEWLRVGGQWLMWQLMCAWNDNLVYPNGNEKLPSVEKEEYYARMFMVGLIRKLRHGYTKSDAYHSDEMFVDFSKHWKWKPWQESISEKDNYSILTCVFRAWDSFYRGFDFTSSIHNAMKWEGNRHLIAMLTASFASAMYGCQYNLIKKKFAKNGQISHLFELYCLGEHFGYHHALCHEMMDENNGFRTFYPKNRALTNVERHFWQSVANPFDRLIFSESDYKNIMKCSPTGWDNRYGLYLDDGWFYVYRSGCLIGRFMLIEEDGYWLIKNVQLSGEQPWREFCNALFCAMTESCNLRGFSGKYEDYASIFKYYQGELTCPEKWKNNVSGKFWHGEMMFCTNHISIEEWTKKAENALKNMEPDKQKYAKSMSLRQFGVILFIETLYSKWCSYDNMDWIYEY